MAAMEARATSVLGWAVAAGTALAAILTDSRFAWMAGAGLLAAILAAICCVSALWPHVWGEPGLRLSQMEDADLASELAYADAYAQGLERTIGKNRKRAEHFSLRLKAAWIALCAIPILAAAGGVAGALAAHP
jgi:hypothetical protein